MKDETALRIICLRLAAPSHQLFEIAAPGSLVSRNRRRTASSSLIAIIAAIRADAALARPPPSRAFLCAARRHYCRPVQNLAFFRDVLPVTLNSHRCKIVLSGGRLSMKRQRRLCIVGGRLAELATDRRRGDRVLTPRS